MQMPNVHEFSSPRPVNATLRVGSGAIVVTAEDSETTTVTITPWDDSEASRAAAENTQVVMNGDRLHISVPDVHGAWLFRRNGRIRVDLRMPLDSQARIQVGSADIHADGRLTLVDVKCGSGDVFASDCVDLSVQSGSGDIRAERIRGTLRVNTGSGDISARRVEGHVTVNTASGDIHLEQVLNGMRITSASGDVRVDSAHGGEVRVNSASGDVNIGVPVGTKVWLDLGSMSGTTSSELPVSHQAPEGGPTLNLQVHTLSGDISVFRSAAALDTEWDAAA